MVRGRKLKLAVVVSHPIQHFAPWHRAVVAEQRIDLQVFFCCDWGIKTYHDPEFGVPIQWDIPLTEGYASEFLPTSRRPTRLDFFSVDNPTVGAALGRYDPDVIQLFGYAHRTNWRAQSWAKSSGVPMLLYSDSNIRARTPFSKRWLKRKIVSHFYKGVDGALYVGDNNRSFHASFGLPDERLFPGSLPVDSQALWKEVPCKETVRAALRQRYGIPDEGFVVLFCGKLSARKRPLDLLAALMSASREEGRLHCIFVGDGHQRDEIEIIVKREGLRNIHLSGFVNQTEIPKFYVAADALVITSSFDPHPLVVTEAGVFGLPIIVSDATGCIGPNDTARPGENALVFPCGDVPALREAILRLARDGGLSKQMGRASEAIALTQDVKVAASQLSEAANRLRNLGPRVYAH
jgi:glycosyltransferase involved in cell wall biosynthesis